MRSRPELAGRILTHGSWDYALVAELTLGADDVVVPKARYSGFCGTDLDDILRARNVRHLIFTGIATNVCVESTLREAYHREYFCLLVADATQHSGPAFVQDAVLYSVETLPRLGHVDRRAVRGTRARLGAPRTEMPRGVRWKI